MLASRAASELGTGQPLLVTKLWEDKNHSELVEASVELRLIHLTPVRQESLGEMSTQCTGKLHNIHAQIEKSSLGRGMMAV